MSDSKAKMLQIRFRLGLRPRPRLGSLSAPLDPLAELRGQLVKGGDMKESYQSSPQFQNLKTATAVYHSTRHRLHFQSFAVHRLNTHFSGADFRDLTLYLRL